MKILAVEDDPIASAVLSASLGALGHDVIQARDGVVAWDLLQREPIRVVVCDWLMPKLDGLELCRRVRTRPGDYVYFILVTNRTPTVENQDVAFAAGVDDFLSKPVDPQDLKTRLHVAQRILAFTSQIQTLETFIPICSYCKKVRDDHSYWQQIESYINQRTGSEFSHSICPDCYEKHITPELKALGLGQIKYPEGKKKAQSWSAGELDTRVARLEERLAWFERHVSEQDKAMLELSDLVERLRREVLTLRERSGAGTAGAAAAGGEAEQAEERPPHY